MSTYSTRTESARAEGTRDPIFLVLVETAQLLDYDEDIRPPLWFRDDDGHLMVYPFDGCCSCHINPPCGHCEGTRRATFDEIVELRNDDQPVCVETAIEGVYLTRQEAEAWVDSHRYRWRSDSRVRVYCVCAEGELASLLKASDTVPA